jgi:hypothetical protein
VAVAVAEVEVLLLQLQQVVAVEEVQAEVQVVEQPIAMTPSLVTTLIKHGMHLVPGY